MPAYKGRYTPKNKDKYLGDYTKIVYRSLLERRVMKHLDETPYILKWSSEEVIIPYISPLDNRQHRYFMDFYCQMKLENGDIKHILIEVKPFSQLKMPKEPKRRSRRFYKDIRTFAVNDAKWKAASLFCEERGWEFRFLTEKQIKLSHVLL